jgi:hypothetical protein
MVEPATERSASMCFMCKLDIENQELLLCDGRDCHRVSHYSCADLLQAPDHEGNW